MLKKPARGRAEPNRPSAAKAAIHFAVLSGTTKVVPFQNRDSRRVFQQAASAPAMVVKIVFLLFHNLVPLPPPPRGGINEISGLRPYHAANIAAKRLSLQIFLNKPLTRRGFGACCRTTSRSEWSHVRVRPSPAMFQDRSFSHFPFSSFRRNNLQNGAEYLDDYALNT